MDEKNEKRFSRELEHLDRQTERIEKRKAHLRKRYNVTESEEKQIREAHYDRKLDKQ